VEAKPKPQLIPIFLCLITAENTKIVYLKRLFQLFIYGLFNDAVRSINYIVE
jgi:hypothetical protein